MLAVSHSNPELRDMTYGASMGVSPDASGRPVQIAAVPTLPHELAGSQGGALPNPDVHAVPVQPAAATTVTSPEWDLAWAVPMAAPVAAAIVVGWLFHRVLR